MSQSDSLTINLALKVEGNENQAFVCQIDSNASDIPLSSVSEGQTPEHAIAIALEQLADHYRNIAEPNELTSEARQKKRYHVILHYERVMTEDSKFEALHNILMGNTVVENAKRWAIEIDSSVQPIEDDWDEDDPDDE
jgi:hypothetical protein